MTINNLIQNGSSHGLKQALSGRVYAGVYVKHANLDLYIDFYVNQEQFAD